MTEPGEFRPHLEIAQPELRNFQNLVGEIVGRTKIIGSREVPCTVDGISKIARLEKSRGIKDRFVKFQLRDESPVNEQYPYEELICYTQDNGRLALGYKTGALTQEELHGGTNTAASFDFGQFVSDMYTDLNERLMTSQVVGEPIDEFRRLYTVLEQIKQENSISAKVKNILRRPKV